MPERSERIELDKPRELGDLITVAFNLFTRHFSLLFTLALIVVAPVGLLIDGVWGRSLAEGKDTDPMAGPTIASVVVGVFLAGPLVTAMAANVVLALREGRVLSVGEALRAALRIFPAAALAIALAALATLGGVVLLIVGSLWIGVLLLFTGQAVVVEGLRGTAALRRSAEIVRGQWWSTFGRILVLNLVAFALTLLPAIIAAGIANGVIYTTLLIVGDALGTAYAAVATTLLFFDRRARKADGWQTDPVSTTPEAP